MPSEPVDDAAIKTYRYLRIGLVGAVVLLAASILIERAEVDCWQRSISAYYYTPVRAIFVGVLMAVGLALIVIKGRTTWIDISLNFAGMLAPVVAVVPTTTVGTCWSIDPPAAPVNEDGTLATWVVANIDNNVWALIITGIVGLVVAAVIASLAKGPTAITSVGTKSMRWGLAASFAFLVVGLLLFRLWDDFYELAHGWAAVLFFAFLAAAVLLNAGAIRGQQDKRVYFVLYLVIAVLMVVAAVVLFPLGWEYNILVLEAVEIALFGIFWAVQTMELWDETAPSPDTASP